MVGSTSLIGLLVLLLIIVVFPAFCIQKKHLFQRKGVVHTMTVLEVSPPEKDADYISVAFQKSQRVYKLPINAHARYLRVLKESERDHTPVRVWRAKEASDVITCVKK